MSLLGKWVWRYGRGEPELWKEIIQDKFGAPEVGGWPPDVSSSYGCSLWRGILATKELFQYVSDKDGLVKYHMVWENNGLTWNFKLRHGVREWHIDGVIRMLDAFAGLTPSVEEDKWVWKQSSNSNFSSRSYYNLLASSIPYPPQPITPKLLSMAWRSGVPPKVQFFLWCLLQ
ncbi:hypothetical protein IFM89_000997 [Coptis chinensis]|uniref:Reverse transcriptase zinc-binding domain-containing protein n=1 Tax=Coptis chinensis TaxID=261450 RepID=A0A835ILB5_9MAGN|nr:hypothetical protein IFM89_000997 [Coptis chinensis]